MKNLTCFTFSTFDEWIERFSVMPELGFFRLTGNRYQMSLPCLSPEQNPICPPASRQNGR